MFSLKTDFRYAQVSFKTGFTVLYFLVSVILIQIATVIPSVYNVFLSIDI
jgi:hypothetical protein